MISLHTETGVLRLRLESVIAPAEMRDARRIGLRCLCEERVEALVIDIRGCKPVDSESLADLQDLYERARACGVERFVRIGDGTLFARQMHALETAAAVSEQTVVYVADAPAKD